MTLTNQRKIELLNQQISDGNDGEPSEFSVWRDKTEVVLRSTVGDASPIYDSFRNVKFRPGMVVYPGTTTEDFVKARRAGVRSVISLLKAAVSEIEITGGLPTPTKEGAVSSSVFIVHGRDEARKETVARFLAKATGNEPVILHEQASGGKTIMEKLEQYAAEAGYAVVLATGDDLGRLAGSQTESPRARQNVVFELGYFFGLLGRDNVALLYDSGVERPSDTDGIVHIALDDSGAWKATLLREIENAGIGVEWASLR